MLDSLGLLHLPSQTPSESSWRFFQKSRLVPMDRQSDQQDKDGTQLVRTGCLRYEAMRPNNNNVNIVNISSTRNSSLKKYFARTNSGSSPGTVAMHKTHAPLSHGHHNSKTSASADTALRTTPNRQYRTAYRAGHRV